MREIVSLAELVIQLELPEDSTSAQDIKRDLDKWYKCKDQICDEVFVSLLEWFELMNFRGFNLSIKCGSYERDQKL